MCALSNTPAHTEHLQWRGIGAYPPVGGADIYAENSPLLSESGFMISL